MFDFNGHINPDYNSSKKTGLIAKILEDNWDAFYEANKYLVDVYRPNAKKEFKKAIRKQLKYELLIQLNFKKILYIVPTVMLK